jgi:hypothetical protein
VSLTGLPIQSYVATRDLGRLETTHAATVLKLNALEKAYDGALFAVNFPERTASGLRDELDDEIDRRRVRALRGGGLLRGELGMEGGFEVVYM